MFLPCMFFLLPRCCGISWNWFANLIWMGQCGLLGLFNSKYNCNFSRCVLLWNYAMLSPSQIIIPLVGLLSTCQHFCHLVGGWISVCHHMVYFPHLIGSIEQVLGNSAAIHSLHITGPYSAELWWISFENCCDGCTSIPGYNLAYNLIFSKAPR